MCIKNVENMQFNGQNFKISNNVYFIEQGCNLRLQLILQLNFVFKKISYFFFFSSKRVFKNIFWILFYSLKVLAILRFGLSKSLFIGLKQNHFLAHYMIPNNQMIQLINDIDTIYDTNLALDRPYLSCTVYKLCVYIYICVCVCFEFIHGTS